MSLNFWSRRNLPSSGGRARAARAQPYRPALEALEDRLVPATHIWQGPATGGLWSQAANWIGGVPTTGEAGGTIVQFNGGIDSTDDVAGLVVDQIHFTAGGNTIRGTTTLGLDGSKLDNLLNDSGTNTLDASLPVALSNVDTVVVTAGQVTVNGNLSGNQGIAEVAGSAGNLILAGNNFYTGPTRVLGGTLFLTGNSPACTGDTLVDGGTLSVNADYSGSQLFLYDGTLAGTGTVQRIDTTQSFGSGNMVISPGGLGTVGTLSTAPGFDSTLQGATFQVRVANQAASDQLVIGTGAIVDLTGATLSVNVLGSAVGNVYTIVSSTTGGIHGTFNGLTDGATFSAGGRTFRIHYTASAVTLTDLATTPSVSVAYGPQGLVTEEVFSNGNLVQVSPAGSINVGPDVHSAAIAFNPVTGEAVLEVVSLNGQLTQYDPSGIHVMAQDVRSVALAFSPAGAASLYVVSLDGTLTLYDATGVHTVGNSVQDVSLAFAPAEQPVMDVVSFDGTLTQYDATSIHTMGANALAATMAFLPNGEAILDVVSPNGLVTQYDSTGTHPLLTNALFASLSSSPSGAVLDVLFQNGALEQFGPSGAQFRDQLF
jgi:autotransporter-associated beta strand protein